MRSAATSASNRDMHSVLHIQMNDSCPRNDIYFLPPAVIGTDRAMSAPVKRDLQAGVFGELDLVPFAIQR